MAAISTDALDMRTVFRSGELITLHGRGKVRHAIASGRWQSPCRGVVVTHSAPLSREENDLVALQMCAPGSAFSGASSLVRDGFKGFDSTATYVVLPEGADRPRREGIAADITLITHWSTDLGDQDVHPNRKPRRTRPARSLIDMAGWCDHDRYARTVIIAGMQQGLADERRMHEAIDRRGTCLRRALIRESVLDAAGGIQSLPERDFDDIRIGAGLPAPTRQVKVQTPSGRYFLDVTWEEFQLTVEVHGAQHQQSRQWDADLLRGNEIVIGGRRQLIFASYAIRRNKPQVAGQLRRMFFTLGWRANGR